MDDNEIISVLALRKTEGVGDHLIKQLVAYCGSASDVLKKPRGKLEKIPGIGHVIATAILQKSTREWAEKEYQKVLKKKCDILLFHQEQYPKRLKNIPDAPAILFYDGNLSLNYPRAVGIVGTRHATPYGIKQVNKMVEALHAYHPVIISGLAYGIDIEAHRVALKNGLDTLGVMGSGLDVIYPSAHRETAEAMKHQGGLITEQNFGVKPDAHHFPARNRIIAAMSDVLILVEAATKGGALITAHIANGYDKEVYAVPGDLDKTYSAGCNELISKNYARIFISIAELAEDMRWTSTSQATKQTALDFSALSDDEQKIVTVLKAKNAPVQIDDLIFSAQLNAGEAASTLLNLEFKNIVKALPGKQFSLY